MKVLYFARFRQIIGRSEQVVEIPDGVTTVQGLLDLLIASDNACAAAFSNPKVIRAAVDQNHAGLDASIVGAGEVAFFPPVTGG